MIDALAAATLAAVVSQVYPSSRSVPEALLRISLVFASPQPARTAQHVRLRYADGSFAVMPFADPPLWSPDRRLLTLLLDPSRQKVGLRDHVSSGYVLRANQDVEVMLDDAVVAKRYVTSGACPAIAPSSWRISSVAASTMQPLMVRFPSPIDALSVHDIAVIDASGRLIDGIASLDGGEAVWHFMPSGVWPSDVRLAVNPRLEDACGDEVGEPFEHAAGSGLGAEREATLLRVPVRRAPHASAGSARPR